MNEKCAVKEVAETKVDIALGMIKETMGEVTGEIRMAEELMLQLERKLEKVLTPARPIPLEDGMSNQAEVAVPASPLIETLVGLNSSISIHRYQISELGEHIKEIIERLEI